MAKNVFEKIGDIKNDIRTNNFDLSFANNLTTGFGRITPVFCKRLPPKSSIRINPKFALQFMPMMFPVQTRMKAYLSFYRVPLRTLWKDYKNWISSPNDSTADFTPPYMYFNSSAFGKGNLLGVSGLADYLGVPVTAFVSSLSPGQYATITGLPVSPLMYTYDIAPEFYAKTQKLTAIDSSNKPTPSIVTNVMYLNAFNAGYLFDMTQYKPNSICSVPVSLQISFTNIRSYNKFVSESSHYKKSNNRPLFSFFTTSSQVKASTDLNFGAGTTTGQSRSVSVYYEDLVFDSSSNSVSATVTLIYRASGLIPSLFLNVLIRGISSLFKSADASPYYSLSDSVSTFVLSSTSSDITTLSASSSPFCGTGNLDGLKISAYPFRAYESIYNAYIRNNKNNPFIKNGKKVYNEWITTDEGGQDDTEYNLFHSNWASDAFTTALPSPQQGLAPLVGLTTYTTQSVDPTTGYTSTLLNTALVDEDGNKYKVDFQANGNTLKQVNYTKLSSDTAVTPVSSMFDLINSGISINDFRNVNAYQRYLELNQFRGFSYKDIVEGRFDVNIRYDDLMMPEYLGGITRDVQISPITQTVETSSDGTYIGSLGSQSGVGFVSGSTDVTIKGYCDEESLIIGLMWVNPMPVYTQNLPKHFLYTNRLDSFNPEFDHIGYQPITVKELAPIQAYVGGVDLDKVFGYQRPWYEYVQSVDEAHGIFKTELRNFLINRTYEDVPELGSKFTTISESDVNDVFSVTEVSDKIFGQIYFDVTASLPISRVVVPKLE